MKKIFVKIEYPQTTIKPSHLIKEELIEQVKAEILAMDLPIITTGLLTNPLTIQHKMYLYVLTEQQLESIKHEAVKFIRDRVKGIITVGPYVINTDW